MSEGRRNGERKQARHRIDQLQSAPPERRARAIAPNRKNRQRNAAATALRAHKKICAGRTAAGCETPGAKGKNSADAGPGRRRKRTTRAHNPDKLKSGRGQH